MSISSWIYKLEAQRVCSSTDGQGGFIWLYYVLCISGVNSSHSIVDLLPPALCGGGRVDYTSFCHLLSLNSGLRGQAPVQRPQLFALSSDAHMTSRRHHTAPESIRSVEDLAVGSTGGGGSIAPSRKMFSTSQMPGDASPRSVAMLPPFGVEPLFPPPASAPTLTPPYHTTPLGAMPPPPPSQEQQQSPRRGPVTRLQRQLRERIGSPGGRSAREAWAEMRPGVGGEQQ